LRSALSHLDPAVGQAVSMTAADLGLAKGVAVDFHRSKALAHRLTDRETSPSEADVGAPAVASLSNDVLAGWHDDWAVIAAEKWRQLRLRALEAVAAQLTAAGRFPEAAAAALAAVSAERLRESAWATLIRVHVAEGDKSAALGQFERYRSLLHTELGLKPTRRLARLVSDLELR
jgi:two-component SAPR family response regulator